MGITVQEVDHEIWGPCVFLEGEGAADDVVDAYAREAPFWPLLHFAIAAPDELEPWYRLGFAQMHAYGRRASGSEPVSVPGVTLRPGDPDDLETALRLDRLVYDAQRVSPSFSSFDLDEAKHRADWIETLAADDVTYVVAEAGGAAVGHATVYPDPHDDGALHLASTAVLPEAQGRGIGLALTAHALEHAREAGRPRMWTNWRVTNVRAARFWAARGFEVARIRLVRQLPTL